VNNPYISIVIPTLGRNNVLETCLDSLTRQTFTDFEVVIITDNKKGTESLNKKFPQLTLSIIEQDKKGLAYARNMGLNNSKGKIVTFTDDDVALSQDWAKEVSGIFNSSEGIGGVSGPTIIPEALVNNRDILAFHSKTQKNLFWRIIGKIYTYCALENQPEAVGKIFRSGAFSLGSNYKKSAELPSPVEVDYLEACNMSFRKDILDKTGGFSPEYKGIGDWSEPDLAFRVKQQGYKLVFNPHAIVYHNISQAGVFKQRGADSCQRMVNFVYFYKKWFKLNSLDKIARFSFNLCFLSLYWIFKFLQTGNTAWLGGIKGIFVGLARKP